MLATFRTLGALALGSAMLIAVSQALAAGAPAPAPDSAGLARTVLVDNNKVLITLSDFKAGYDRTQPTTRQADQMVVYLDNGAEAPQPSSAASPKVASGTACASSSMDCGPIDADSNAAGKQTAIARGSVVWHPKGSSAAPLHVTKGYRALVIELKHGTMTAPDPAAAKLPREPVVGGGAPTKILIDNDMIRANLVSFPTGFIRAGGYRRRLDTVIAYVDDAELKDVGPSQKQFDVVQQLDAHPDAIAQCPPIKDCDSVAPTGKWAKGPTVRGTVAWHQQDGYVERIQIGKAYRALYIELK